MEDLYKARIANPRQQGNKKKEYESGLYNGWAGLCWLIVLIPCFLYFVNHELYLNLGFSKTVVAKAEVVIPSEDPRLRDSPLLNDNPFLNDGSLMMIITEKDWFI
jgi:hypothetical protein